MVFLWRVTVGDVGAACVADSIARDENVPLKAEELLDNVDAFQAEFVVRATAGPRSWSSLPRPHV